jgi:hypothetical protein
MSEHDDSEESRPHPLLRIAIFVGLFAALRACISEDDGVVPVPSTSTESP